MLEDMPEDKRRTINGEEAIQRLGIIGQKRLAVGLPALQALQEAVKRAVKEKGYLRGLDGRTLTVRSAHAALNTLLQSAGALIMKRALVILNDKLKAEGLTNSYDTPNYDFEFVANIHDEFQIEVKPQHVELVSNLAKQSIADAGTAFNFRCALSGSANTGLNWAETH